MNNPHAYILASGSDVAPDRIKVHRWTESQDRIMEVKAVIKTMSLQGKQNTEKDELRVPRTNDPAFTYLSRPWVS